MATTAVSSLDSLLITEQLPPEFGANGRKIRQPKHYAYVRVSTKPQDVANQERTIETFCRQRDIRLAKIVRDQSVSGTFGWKYRGLADLLATTRKDDCIIVYDISRLGRRANNIDDFIKECQQKFVKILLANMPEIVIADEEQIKLECKRQGKEVSSLSIMFTHLFVKLLTTFAQMERDATSERTKVALAAKKAKGVVMGRKKKKYESKDPNAERDSTGKLLNVYVSPKFDRFRGEIIEMLREGLSGPKMVRRLKAQWAKLYKESQDPLVARLKMKRESRLAKKTRTDDLVEPNYESDEDDTPVSKDPGAKLKALKEREE
jgi:putative DNA-invertase from lambdoid prophage Rac